MIITKTPLRVSFCGGGTDLPDFYKKYNGQVLSTTIDKYMYILVKKQTGIIAPRESRVEEKRYSVKRCLFYSVE